MKQVELLYYGPLVAGLVTAIGLIHQHDFAVAAKAVCWGGGCSLLAMVFGWIMEWIMKIMKALSK